MKIEDLEVFIAAAESEKFITPDQSFHRFTSSASEEILNLEAEFGTQLFIREGNATGILTEAGNTLLQNGKPLVQLYRKTMRSMDQYRSMDDCAIIIGTLPILRQYRLVNMFRNFMDDHEDLDMRIEETDGNNLLEGLMDGYYDGVVIRKNMLTRELLENTDLYRLASDEMTAILWKDHRLAGSGTLKIEQLKNETFFLTNPNTPSFGLCWKLLKDHHLSTENVRTTEIEYILPAVAEKQGVGLLPVSNVTRARQDGITAIPLRPRVAMEIVFAVKKDSVKSANMQELIRTIEKRAKAVPK